MIFQLSMLLTAAMCAVLPLMIISLIAYNRGLFHIVDPDLSFQAMIMLYLILVLLSYYLLNRLNVF